MVEETDMTGRFLRVTEHPHACAQPPVTEFDGLAEGETWPSMRQLARGTVWQCDACGRVWVVAGFDDWRPERFWERWRRQRADR